MNERVKLTNTQAAEALGKGLRTVARLCKTGELEGGRDGRRAFIYADSVEKYERDHEPKMTVVVVNPQAGMSEECLEWLVRATRRAMKADLAFKAAEGITHDEPWGHVGASMSFCRALGDREFQDPVVRAVARELATMTYAVATAHKPGQWTFRGERQKFLVAVAGVLREHGRLADGEKLSQGVVKEIDHLLNGA